MYKITAGASHLPPTPAAMSTHNYSYSRRERSPMAENARRPRSPPAQTFNDPMIAGIPKVQKSQPIHYAGHTPEYTSRRPLDRTARSVSPLRSERPPAHIRAKTPPAPRFEHDQRGFLTPQTQASEYHHAPRSPPRETGPFAPAATMEARGREEGRNGLREGMAPGPHFYEHQTRRTTGLRIVTDTENVEVPAPLQVRKPSQASVTPKTRKAIPSMCDYLSLEQLENLWSSQDMYKGTIEAPQSRPRLSPVERAKILEAREKLGDLPLHPAFRNVQSPTMVN